MHLVDIFSSLVLAYPCLLPSTWLQRQGSQKPCFYKVTVYLSATAECPKQAPEQSSNNQSPIYGDLREGRQIDSVRVRVRETESERKRRVRERERGERPVFLQVAGPVNKAVDEPGLQPVNSKSREKRINGAEAQRDAELNEEDDRLGSQQIPVCS